MPTFKELGYPDVEFYIWAGLFAPKGMPAPVVTKLRETMKQAMSDPEVTKTFEAAGNMPAYQETGRVRGVRGQGQRASGCRRKEDRQGLTAAACPLRQPGREAAAVAGAAMPSGSHLTVARNHQHHVETRRTAQGLDGLLRRLRDRASDVE